MKTKHEKVNEIDKVLVELGYDNEFDVNLKLIKNITHNYINPTITHKYANMSKKNRQKRYVYFYQMVARDVLKVLYRRNANSAKNIKAGFVYAITNPAWEGWVKIGSAIDVNDRLNSYQTSSPNRDFKLETYFFTLDRRNDEKNIHSMFDDRQGEWCRTDANQIARIFKKHYFRV